ncbi:pyridoxal phosphate-dependent aminotransferase family protein, partial [Candidatus Woesearchaeota archaeon]|nr:pyridoxal phosphate-dependent aminotransferase family protein [Candidatus Woesearchaeota archaeon]
MMSKSDYKDLLKNEIQRIDESFADKRNEIIIESYTPDGRAVVAGKKYLIFNSNDYLGLRFHPAVNQAEEEATKKFGSGPGGVRFICGTMKVHRDLEKALAKFHGREEGMIFSSAFAANLAVLHCIIKGQSKSSLVRSNTLVISDEFNHRSIIDGIRVAQVPKDGKLIFKHRQLAELDKLLTANRS